MATRNRDLPAGSLGYSNNNNGRVPQPPVGVPHTTTPQPTVTNSNVPGGSGAGMVGLNSTKLQSGQELADLFGHIFGYDNIYKILQDATKEKFNSWDAQTRQTRDAYMSDMANTQQGIMDNSRNIRQQAVRSGLSKGSNVAAEVMQQMASQQQGMGVQQEYRGVLNNISNERASQQGADIYNAMAMQNELANQLGTMSVNNRANSVQELASRLGYNAQIDSNNATRYAANQSAAVGREQLAAQMGYFNALKAQGLSDVDAWRISTAQDPEKVLADVNKANQPAKPGFFENLNNFATNLGRNFANRNNSSNNQRTPQQPNRTVDDYFKDGGLW